MFSVTEEMWDQLTARVAALEAQKSRRATRLPDGYMPNQATVEAIRTEFPGYTDDLFLREHRKFCDYWYGVPGQRGTKLDWEGTWRNWMRKAAESMRLSLRTSTDTKMTGYISRAERLAAEVEDEDAEQAQRTEDQAGRSGAGEDRSVRPELPL